MTHFQEQMAVRSALSKSRKRYVILTDVESIGFKYVVRDNDTGRNVSHWNDLEEAIEHCRYCNS